MIPQRVRFVKNFFEILFSKLSRFIGFIAVCGAVLSLSAADLIYNTRFVPLCQHFFEKVFSIFSMYTKAATRMRDG